MIGLDEDFIRITYSEIALRGCLKKIDKIAYFIVFGVISLSGSVKSRDFEQSLVWLGLNSPILACS